MVRRAWRVAWFCLLAAVAWPCLAAQPPTTLQQLIAGSEPVVVAHGKNVNVAEESTWPNILHAVGEGAQALEFDVQALAPDPASTSGELPFIIFHDPTPHRLVRGYVTSGEKVEAFWRRSPELARAKQGTVEFNLFDRMATFAPAEARRTLWIHDERSGRDYQCILLEDFLQAFRTPGVLAVPAYRYRTAEGQVVEEPARRLVLARPVFLYLDLKDLNPLARKLNGLPSWDWERGALSVEQLTVFVQRVLSSLADVLHRHDALATSFLTVRHEDIATLAREVEPRLLLMASTELATRDTPPAELVAHLERFAPLRPELVELKYLRHVRAPEVHEAARRWGAQVFYNEIVQTDPGQFEGPYQGRLDLLVQDLLGPSRDVFVQTNTVADLAALFAAGAGH